MHDHSHSTIFEGILAGLIGALVVAAWYLAVDLGRGEVWYTPNVLGQVFIARDTMPTVRHIVPQAVAEYSVLHLVVFVVLGIALTALTHLATRNPALRMGVWLGLVISLVFFLGFLYMLFSITGARFPWITSLGGGLLGVGAMGWYLWRKHPALRGTFDQAPLGAEGRSPPHPRGGPRM